MRKRDWAQALRGALVLARYHPRGLALLLLNERSMQWHMERRRLALRLRFRQQDLEARQQQLRLYRRRLTSLKGRPENHERQIKELESVLAKERRELQRLRRRTRRLALRIQELDRWATNGRIFGTWELLKRHSSERLGRVLGKASWR
jgi:septal ring factor EnvC (AmiA/AmiB activator)